MIQSKEGESVFDADKINNQLNELNKIYNTAVDDCIEVMKSHYQGFTGGILNGTYQSIIQKLEQLKKDL